MMALRDTMASWGEAGDAEGAGALSWRLGAGPGGGDRGRLVTGSGSGAWRYTGAALRAWSRCHDSSSLGLKQDKGHIRLHRPTPSLLDHGSLCDTWPDRVKIPSSNRAQLSFVGADTQQPR